MVLARAASLPTMGSELADLGPRGVGVSIVSLGSAASESVAILH
jgi:hypothetical protein